MSNKDVAFVREAVKSNLGRKVRIRFHAGKRKFHITEGVLSETYPSIFLVKVGKEVDQDQRRNGRNQESQVEEQASEHRRACHPDSHHLHPLSRSRGAWTYPATATPRSSSVWVWWVVCSCCSSSCGRSGAASRPAQPLSAPNRMPATNASATSR